MWNELIPVAVERKEVLKLWHTDIIDKIIRQRIKKVVRLVMKRMGKHSTGMICGVESPWAPSSVPLPEGYGEKQYLLTVSVLVFSYKIGQVVMLHAVHMTL